MELQAVVDSLGVADRVTVLQGDVRRLPFGDGEFDAIISIDAFTSPPRPAAGPSTGRDHRDVDAGVER
jgi:ubiquinone/menaquinone biosynthesis C-methylase UbiE